MTDHSLNQPPVSSAVESESTLAARVAASREANKRTLFDALSAAGIARVDVRFDGYGDSGQIEDIKAVSGDQVVDLPSTPVSFVSARRDHEPTPLSVRETVEELAYGFLDDVQSGWTDNDGAFGDFVFDVRARTITLEFNERYTDSTSYNYSF